MVRSPLAMVLREAATAIGLGWLLALAIVAACDRTRNEPPAGMGQREWDLRRQAASPDPDRRRAALRAIENELAHVPSALEFLAFEHQRDSNGEEEDRILDLLIVIAPRDRDALLLRAHNHLRRSSMSATTRRAQLEHAEALLARARAIEDGCDAVELEHSLLLRWDEILAPVPVPAGVDRYRVMLGRCPDRYTRGRAHAQLARLLSREAPGEAATHACAAVELARLSAQACLAGLEAFPDAGRPAVTELARALLTDDPGAKLAALDRSLALEPELVEALETRMWALHALGRATEACAAIEPYLAAWAPTLAHLGERERHVLTRRRALEQSLCSG